jgi:hypothetical protein
VNFREAMVHLALLRVDLREIKEIGRRSSQKHSHLNVILFPWTVECDENEYFLKGIPEKFERLFSFGTGDHIL